MIKNKDISVVPIKIEYTESLRVAIGSVARERKYLFFLNTPPLKIIRNLVCNSLKNDTPHLVAMKDGKVVGWCSIASQEKPIFKHSGVLFMGVLPDYRCMGVGSALLKAALDKSKQCNFSRIELTVREPNKSAINLYQNFGFVVEGIKKKAVFLNNQYENLIIMALTF